MELTYMIYLMDIHFISPSPSAHSNASSVHHHHPHLASESESEGIRIEWWWELKEYSRPSGDRTQIFHCTQTPSSTLARGGGNSDVAAANVDTGQYAFIVC